jgi:hypothetical protein
MPDDVTQRWLQSVPDDVEIFLNHSLADLKALRQIGAPIAARIARYQLHNLKNARGALALLKPGRWLVQRVVHSLPPDAQDVDTFHPPSALDTLVCSIIVP